LRQRRAVLPALCGVALAAIVAPPAAPAGAASTCPAPPGYTAQRVKVPLDRSGRDKGTISLCVQRKPASGKRTGALFFLAGGPGQSATVALTDETSSRQNTNSLLGGALKTRDLVVFDQRGTGRSGNLRCSNESIARCARSLGKGRTNFTTPDSVEDIEAIRRKLGVPKVVLMGVSYGTKVAEAYALRYPKRVERLVLDSILVPEGPDALSRDETLAIPRLLNQACAEGRCASFTSDPAADLHELVTRMAKKPLRGKVVDAYGERDDATLSRSDLLGLIISGDFDEFVRGALPAAVRAALDGDPTPLLRMTSTSVDILGPIADGPPPGPTPEFSDALFVATTCEETSLPWPSTASPADKRRAAATFVKGRPASDFYPFDAATALTSEPIADCDEWPGSSTPPKLGAGPYPNVPSLLVGGEDDVRTSIEQLQTMATRLPGATTLTVAATGHSVLFRRPVRPQIACARVALRAFFAGKPVPARCDGPRPFLPEPPPPPTLAAVSPPAGLDPAAGRSLAAVALTVADAMRQARRVDLAGVRLDFALVTTGALRGGRAVVATRLAKGGEIAIETLELRSAAGVTGVPVTGKLEVRSGALRGTLTVGGPEQGTVTLRDGTLGGTLGGNAVSMPFAPPIAAAARASAPNAR
jgi:pimeloyl-ACP methyl ester carboxylesterase